MQQMNILREFSVRLSLRDRERYAALRQFELNRQSFFSLADDEAGMFITESDAGNIVKWIKFWDNKIISGYQVIVINSNTTFCDIAEEIVEQCGRVSVLKPRESQFRHLSAGRNEWGEHTILVQPLALKNLKQMVGSLHMPLVHYCVVDPLAKMHTYKGRYDKKFFIDDIFTNHTLEMINTSMMNGCRTAFSLITSRKPKELWTDVMARAYGLNAWRFFNLDSFRSA